MTYTNTEKPLSFELEAKDENNNIFSLKTSISNVNNEHVVNVTKTNEDKIHTAC
ncbi:hypothetical protein [Oceanobacillus rekensis]|uniref:hypothetical protein n=1 Tax=Oceanobacillus rekensis TaxID=937927 RepID=UPI001592BEA6|nr:hypothetical protein [Oceanobacillus rekensis]